MELCLYPALLMLLNAAAGNQFITFTLICSSLAFPEHCQFVSDDGVFDGIMESLWFSAPWSMD